MPFFCTLKGLSNKQKIFFMSYALDVLWHHLVSCSILNSDVMPDHADFIIHLCNVYFRLRLSLEGERIAIKALIKKGTYRRVLNRKRVLSGRRPLTVPKTLG